MAENTKIEWADHTFNPWIGCAKVSPACDNCYAERTANHRGWHDWQNATPRHLTGDDYWKQPHRWNRAAFTAGTPASVFCGSLMDIFDPVAPQDTRDRLYDVIRRTPWLIWMLLTKRPKQATRMLPDDFDRTTYPNVWLGVTGENQEQYERCWSLIARVPAVKRFVSVEPMLGPVAMTTMFGRFGKGAIASLEQPDWIICGGESGPNARPINPHWVYDLEYTAAAQRIPFFFKQWGHYRHHPLARTLPIDKVKELDPPTNGKGGALLHVDVGPGYLRREVPHMPTPVPRTRIPIPLTSAT